MRIGNPFKDDELTELTGYVPEAKSMKITGAPKYHRWGVILDENGNEFGGHEDISRLIDSIYKAKQNESFLKILFSKLIKLITRRK